MNDKRKKLLDHLGRLSTEQRNPQSTNLDRLSAIEICNIINAEDKTVAHAVQWQLSHIARAAEMVAETIKKGGRLFYTGAGTSGRLGVLDAAECPPTFGTEPEQVVGVIAGGKDTLIRSAEGVEDQFEEAAQDLQKYDFGQNDMLIGLAASVKTPYTQAGIIHAREAGAKTVLIVCNKVEQLAVMPDVLIQLDVGPEVITGSTRMKSGTAQKMTLNMITTTAMVLLGKCWGNLMVDLRATSDKLAVRSRKILIEVLDIEYEMADTLLIEAGGSVKLAIAMNRLGVNRAEAEKRLAEVGGFLWKLLDSPD
ncbi:MAG: N-acetylmuramic acid 6-phosphate etherase [FCB group bacterium]|nr:N-acetylmuramic acid 6-phosphate etherase [FCB group bacterium]